MSNSCSLGGTGREGSTRACVLVRTLIVVYDISEVVSAAIVCLAHAHGVVREVDVAIVACDVAVS